MDEPEEEVRRLRRCLRDVVAMTMLPAGCAGYDAVHIFNDLVDVVIRTVDADGVLLTVSGRATFDILCLRDETDPHLAGLLREWATAPAAGDEPVACGGRELRFLSYPLIAGSDDRLVAASYRPDFPSESER